MRGMIRTGIIFIATQTLLSTNLLSHSEEEKLLFYQQPNTLIIFHTLAPLGSVLFPKNLLSFMSRESWNLDTWKASHMKKWSSSNEWTRLLSEMMMVCSMQMWLSWPPSVFKEKGRDEPHPFHLDDEPRFSTATNYCCCSSSIEVGWMVPLIRQVTIILLSYCAAVCCKEPFFLGSSFLSHSIHSDDGSDLKILQIILFARFFFRWQQSNHCWWQLDKW